MTIPRKGSRRIEVDGVAYRWTIRPKPSYLQALSEAGGLTVAVELADGPGTVLVASFQRSRPDNWLNAPSAAVTPKHVAEVIREALAAGWVPHSTGGAFLHEVRGPG